MATPYEWQELRAVELANRVSGSEAPRPTTYFCRARNASYDGTDRRISGGERERGLVFGAGFAPAIEVGELVGDVGVETGGGRAGRGGAAEPVERGGVVAAEALGIAEVLEGLWKLRPQAQRLPVGRDGLVQGAAQRELVAEVVVALGDVRPERERATKQFDRVLRAPPLAARNAP